MDKNCSVYRVSDLIGKKWTLLILLELNRENKSVKRFNEIKDNIPKITSKILSLRLKELELEGLIDKKIKTNEFEIKSEYALTESGKDFLKIIQEIKLWSLKWFSESKTKNHDKICKNTVCNHCNLR